MSFTYSADTLSTNTIHHIRFLLADTTEATALLQDEEIQFLLDTYTTVNQTASEAAWAIGLRLSREANSKTLGDLSVSGLQDRAKFYFSLADKLYNRSGSSTGFFTNGTAVKRFTTNQFSNIGVDESGD